MAKRPDWSHRLPRPLTIPGIMTLATLADVRALIEKHLPKEWRERSTWRVVADDLEAAARGADPRGSKRLCSWCWRSSACRAGRALLESLEYFADLGADRVVYMSY